MEAQEVVARTLVQAGVSQVFGVIGSGNYAVTRSMVHAGASYVAARHEQAATSMADAWTRTTGEVAAVTVHQGCGLTNTITALTEAAKSRTPLVVLAAETGAGALHSNFRIAQDRLVESVGARSLRITAATAARDAALAHRIAVTERIPVLVNLPLDVQQQPAVLDDLPPLIAAAPAPTSAQVRALADAFARASRPVIIAGRGARDAGPALQALGEVSGALLATSAVVRGLFRGSAWDLDVSGGFATPLTAELISEADLVVSFGCALNMWTTRHGRLISPAATVIQVDHDPLAPGRHHPIELGVVGDSRVVADLVTAELRCRDHSDPGWRSDGLRERIAAEGRWRQVPYEDLSGNDRIDPRALTIELDDLLDTDRVVSVDSGNFMGYPSMLLDIPDVGSLCFTQAFQCVGLGLGTAIGAALARPERLPVLGTGDGGLLMAATELETVVRLGLPMVIVVYNDGGYGAEVHHFGRTDADDGFVTFGDTDFAAIGRGYGFDSVTVRRREDLAGVADWLSGPRQRPLLIDAKVVSTEPSWWLAEAFLGH